MAVEDLTALGLELRGGFWVFNDLYLRGCLPCIGQYMALQV